MEGTQIELDSLYGIQNPFTTNLVINDLLVMQIIKIKKWKRLNRPSKFKTKMLEIPYCMIAEPPMVTRTTIFCHSKIANLLK